MDLRVRRLQRGSGQPLRRLWLSGIGLFFLLGALAQSSPVQSAKAESTDATKAAAIGDAAPVNYPIRRARVPRRLKGRSFGRAKYVLILSLDGLSYKAFRRFYKDMPTILRLARRGFWRPAYTVFPSVTWASHMTMVTGQYPARHGVLGNRWLENYRTLHYPYQTDVVEAERFQRTPALWDLTAKKGWRSASINWPATQRSNIFFNLPEIMYRRNLVFRYMSRPMKRVIRGQYKKHVGRVPMWRSRMRRLLSKVAYNESTDTDALMTDLAASLIDPKLRVYRKKRDLPRLMLLHFMQPDAWLHKYGNVPWIHRWGMRQADGLLAQMINAYKRAGIWRQTAVFVTSDHGFLSIRNSMDLRLLFYKAGLNKTRSMSYYSRKKAKVMAFFNGHTAFLYVRPRHQARTIPAVMRLLRKSEYDACIEKIYQPSAYKKMGLPVPTPSRRKKGEYRPGEHLGAPSLVVMSKPDCVFRRRHSKRVVLYSFGRGAEAGFHGYRPDHPDMWSFVMGAGAGIRAQGQGPLNMSHLVDLAPTVAHLMGLTWPRYWPRKGKNRRRLKIAGRIMRRVLSTFGKSNPTRRTKRRRRKRKKR